MGLTGLLGRLQRRSLRAIGEAVHHSKVSGKFARSENCGTTIRNEAYGDSSTPYRGNTNPTYPYLETRTDPLSPRPTARSGTPVLTAGDVTDFGNTDAVADPFLFATDSGDWHMFFEVFNEKRDPTAAIGHARSPDGGHTWYYDRVVVATDSHLSFPYVFMWDGAHYMLPDAWSKEKRQADVTLYRARQFPQEWTPVAEIVSPDRPMHDCVVFRWKKRWWALLGDQRNLFAFHSDTLEADGWQPHERNPVVTDRLEAGRPAGRPIVRPNYILLYLQDCTRRYGHKVRAYRITELTPSMYADHEVEQSPVLEPSTRLFGWNSGGMHHIDPWYVDGRWRCAVDGDVGLGHSRFGDMWAIGVYESP